MKRRMALALRLLVLLFTLTNIAYAADESFAEQFLGNPLLILTAIVVIDIIALIYHRIRK